MSNLKLGINGFGRIGRILFRATLNKPNVEIVGVNDLLEVDQLAYLLKYDSVHGRFDGTVEVKDGHLVVNGKTIRVTAERVRAEALEEGREEGREEIFHFKIYPVKWTR